jgi:hypothetical protein
MVIQWRLMCSCLCRVRAIRKSCLAGYFDLKECAASVSAFVDVCAVVRLRTVVGPVGGWLFEEPGDLHEVVVEDAVPAPGSGAVESIEAGPVEAEVAFGAADPSFAARSPSDQLFERAALFDLASRGGGSAFAGEHDLADARGFHGVFDSLFAVTAVGSDRARGHARCGV